MGAPDYQKIKEVGNCWYGRNNIYADEHGLLLVKVSLSHEVYRKIAFSDLCGFTITGSRTYAVYNMIFIPLALLFAGLAYYQNFEVPILAGLAFLFGVLAIVNLFKGKSCRCVLSTKFTHAGDSGVTRTKRAEKLLEFLRTQVIQTQGEGSLAEEETERRSEEENTAEDRASNPGNA